jgi:hypothetical protein
MKHPLRGNYGTSSPTAAETTCSSSLDEHCRSSVINPTGHHLLEYLVNTNLIILNKGNKTNFVVSNRQEVTHLTLRNDKIGDLVSDWHVSDVTSLSVHRYILLFQVGDLEVSRATYHNPKKTNWKSYHEDNGKSRSCTKSGAIGAVHLVQKAIFSSCHQNCPAKVALSPRRVPWWSKEAKAYCPISLSSFMLKTMEKLVDRSIRDEILGWVPSIDTNLPTNHAHPLKLQCTM